MQSRATSMNRRYSDFSVSLMALYWVVVPSASLPTALPFPFLPPTITGPCTGMAGATCTFTAWMTTCPAAREPNQVSAARPSAPATPASIRWVRNISHLPAKGHPERKLQPELIFAQAPDNGKYKRSRGRGPLHFWTKEQQHYNQQTTTGAVRLVGVG